MLNVQLKPLVIQGLYVGQQAHTISLYANQFTLKTRDPGSALSLGTALVNSNYRQALIWSTLSPGGTAIVTICVIPKSLIKDLSSAESKNKPFFWTTSV